MFNIFAFPLRKNLCSIIGLMFIFGLFSKSLVAFAAPTIGHDEITPWNDTHLNPIETTYEPAMRFDGCQPYPVVNHEGRVTGGLKPTGNRTSGCSDTSKRQVQIRSHCFNQGETHIDYGFGAYFIGQFGEGRVCAVMYSYYFPKDTSSLPFGIGRHRHDWESVIVWLRDEHQVLGVSYSGHGEFIKLRGDDADRIGTHPKVDYTWRRITAGIVDVTHSMREGTRADDTYVTGLNINSWHAMAAYRPNLIGALEFHDFGSAVYPQGNERFAIELQRAWDSNWQNYSGVIW